MPIDKLFYNKALVPGITYFNENTNVCVTTHIYGEYSVFYNDSQRALLKAIAQAEGYAKEKDYGRLLFVCPDSLRMEILNRIIISEKPSFELAEAAISYLKETDYGFKNINKDALSHLLLCFQKDRTAIFKEKMERLPQTITVYRGEADKSTPYNSACFWTLDINVANFFASRLGEENRLITGTVSKENIIYCYDDNEKDVIVIPGTVKIEDMMPVYDICWVQENIQGFKNIIVDKSGIYQAYRDIIKLYYNEMMLGVKGGHDGTHSLRVLFLALIIGMSEGLDFGALECLAEAAAGHDVGRRNECVDDTHGENALAVLLSYDIEVSEDAKFLIRYHCIDDTVAKEALDKSDIVDKGYIWILYEIFKDADALDRVRFGIRNLDITMLRRPISKHLTKLADNSLKGLRL